MSAGDRDVEFNVEAFDRISGTLSKIAKSFDKLGLSIGETGDDAEELEFNFRTLDKMLDEVGETATPTTANRFSILKEAIDGTVTSDNIVSVRALDNEIQRLGEQAGLSEQSINQLRDAGREIAKQFFGTSISAEQLKDDVRELGDESDLSSVQVSVLNRALDQTADSGQILSVEELKDNIEELAIAAGLSAREAKELTQEMDKLLLASIAASGGLTQNSLAAIGLGEAYEDAQGEVEELKEEVYGAVTSLVSFDLKALGTAGVLRILEETTDDTADQFNSLSNALDDLLPENPITTLNLGPVNISLSEMATTIGTLFTFIGPLIMTVLGLGAAIGALGAAVVSFMGIGLLQFLEQIDAMFVGITNRAEAMEALIGGLGLALRDAFAPLFGTDIGGQSPIEFFLSAIRAGLSVVRQFATIMASITDMSELTTLLDRVGTALFTSDEGITMAESLRRAIERLAPIIGDLFVFLINNMPEFIDFASKIAEDTAPALGRVFTDLAPVFAQFISLGAHLIQTLATLVDIGTIVAGVFIILFDVVNDVLFPFFDLGELVQDLIGVIFGVIVAFLALNTIIGVATTATFILSEAVFAASAAYAAYTGSATAALIAEVGLISATWELVTAMTALELAMAATGIGLLIISVGTLLYILLNMRDSVDMITESFNMLNSELSDFFTLLGVSRDTARSFANAISTWMLGPALAFKELLRFILDPGSSNDWWTPIVNGMQQILDIVIAYINLIRSISPGGRGPLQQSRTLTNELQDFGGMAGSASQATYNIVVNGGATQQDARNVRREMEKRERQRRMRTRGTQ